MTFWWSFFRKQNQTSSSPLKETAAKGVDPKKFDSCVDQVKKKGDAENAYAVCNAALKKEADPQQDVGISTALYFPNMESKKRAKVKESAQPDVGVQTKYWFWGMDIPATSKVNQPKPVADRQLLQIKPETTIDKVVSDILLSAPDMSAATFLNTLKSKGVKLSLEGQTEATSAVGQAVGILAGDKKEAAKPAELKHVALHLHERVSFRESATGNTHSNRFKVAMLREGLGNFKDAFFYTRQALESAIPLFEGKKMFADHPDAIEEKARPERSIRDVIGHFENVRVEKDTDGTSLLVGDCVLLPDTPFEWARALVRHAAEFNKKFPDKEFVALSINASGGAKEMPLQEFASGYELTESAKVKINKASEMGVRSVKVVEGFDQAVSVDLVTEPGAGGKVMGRIE